MVSSQRARFRQCRLRCRICGGTCDRCNGGHHRGRILRMARGVLCCQCNRLPLASAVVGCVRHARPCNTSSIIGSQHRRGLMNATIAQPPDTPRLRHPPHRNLARLRPDLHSLCRVAETFGLIHSWCMWQRRSAPRHCRCSLNRLLRDIPVTIQQRTYPEAELNGSFSSLISPGPLFNASRGHGRRAEPDLPETRSCGLVAWTATNS
jgi:hypothetical protein